MSDQSTSIRRPTPIQTPQTMIAGATLPTHKAALLGLLQAAGLSGPTGPVDSAGPPQLIDQDQIGDLAAVAGWMGEHPQSHLVLLVPLPAAAVARRLGEGVVPKAALAQWLDSTQTVLAVVRQHRRRISLLFAEQALSEPDGLLETLNQRLQLDLQAGSPVPDAPELPGAMLRMMAENAIWQSTEARNMAAELSATALPLDNSRDILLPVIDQVFAEYRESIDIPVRAARELREENSLLLTQLHQVQEELESHFLRARASEQQLTEAQQQRDQLRQQLETAHQQPAKGGPVIKDLQEENELLLQQLHHVQEELEHYYLQSMQHAGPDQNAVALQAAHDTIRAIYNSYSWRLTRPLRWFLRIFGAGPAASEKAPLPDNLAAAHDTIQALQNSKSWKITKPLRIFS